MVLPLIPLVGLGALVGGKLLGKAAEAYGNAALEEASSIVDSTQSEVAKTEAEFRSRLKVLRRKLLTYSALIHLQLKDVAFTRVAIDAPLPTRLNELWNRLSKSPAFASPKATSQDVWKMTFSDADTFRRATQLNHIQPGLGGIAHGLAMGKKGWDYAQKCLIHRDYIVRWASSQTTAAGAELASLIKEAEALEADFDRLVADEIHTISQQKSGAEFSTALGSLFQFAELVRRAAEKINEED